MKPEIQNVLSILESEPNNADALAALAAAVEGGGNGKSDPAADRALAEARRSHRERGDFELVLRLLDLELGWQKDAARRADLFVEKGSILLNEFWSVAEADNCFQRALEARPGDAAATEALAQEVLIKENLDKIVKKYRDELKNSTDKQLTASLHVKLAELIAKHQNTPADVEAELRKAVDIDPRNKIGAVHLERTLRAESRWNELAALYQQRLEAVTGKEDRVALLVGLAEVERDALHRPDLAVETMRKVLALDPLNTRAMRVMGDVYTSEGNWQSLATLYENALKARPRGDAEQGILVQLAMITWRKLNNADAAEEHFRKLRTKDPSSPLALEFYRGYYAEKKDPAKLLQVLGQAQKVETDEKKRLALAVEMARVAESSAGSVEKAIDIWKSVFKLDKQSAEAITALKRLYQRTEKWNALLELLKEQIEALPKEAADARIERLLEVVAIYRDKLNLDVMVINTYNTILSLRPDHADALNALAAKYEAMGRWNDLIGVLQRQSDAVADTEEKARLLRRVATLWVEKFGNHNQAVKPLEDLYALVPGDADVVSRLRDIYTKRRAWRALLDLERRELERLTGVARRAKLIEMAKLAAERLGDAHEAIGLWNRLLEDDARDGEALASLSGLYEREKRFPALVEMLSRQRAGVTDPKAALPLLEKIGTLWAERLEAPHKAVEAYQEILRLVPGHQKTVRILRDLFAAANDFSRLEALYAEIGQWDELCETLLGVAERSADTALKLQLYQRVADIAQQQLKQPERAAKAYERILAVDPQNLDAARSLVPIYRRTEKWARLLATYEILLHHAASDDERLELHREIRVLCEEKLGSKQMAFSWCAKAFAIRSDDPGLETELERLARDADAYDQLVAIYSEQATALAESKRKIGRLRQVADLLFAKLNRADDARRYYLQVLERLPGDPPALHALEQIYTQAGSWNELLDIYRQRVAGSPERDKKIELLFKVAWIEEEKGKRLDEAAATYQEILGLDPDRPTAARALRSLERIHTARSDWKKLADVLTHQLELLVDDPDGEVGISYQLGEIHEVKLGHPEVALPFYKRAFARQPSHRHTLAALERYLAEGNPARVEVARLLVPVYEKMEETQRLVDAQAILLVATQKAGNREEELNLLRRLAALVGRRLGDVDAAFGYASRIFELVPGDVDIRRELGELADLLENHDALARLLATRETQVAAESKQLARDLAWELGQLLEDRLKRTADAEKAYQRVLGYDYGHDGALRALERIFRAGERWKELRALLVKRKGLSLDVASQRDLLFQICDLDEGVLDDQVAAARTYLEVLEIDPASARAFKALERIYAAREQWKELDELLGRAVPHAERADERAQLKARRGELHASRLDDANGACDLYEDALAEDAKNDLARKGLEKLMQNPALRQRIARVLEPLYATDEAWPKLVSALQAQREQAKGQDAVALLGRIATIVEERLASRQQAFSVWREALLIEPADETVRGQVERLAILLEKFGDLAEAWEEAERRAEPHDLSLRAQLLRKAATLHDEELNDAAKARAAWRRLLDLDPTNLETARPAAKALERLYQAQEAWADLIDMLRRQAEWADTVDVKKDFLRRIGLIQEDLTQDYVAAVKSHREILDLDPEDRAALDALERLHMAQDEWADLIGVLRRRVTLSPGVDERRDLLWRIAELTEHKLKLPASSSDVIAGYTAVLDEQAEDVPALDALARLYQAADRPADLLDVLERRLLLENAVAARVVLRGRIARLLEGPLGRAAEALDRYREMVIDDPDNETARVGLERMLSDADLRLRAAEVLEPIYEGAGDDAKLIHLCELWAEHAPDPKDRIARLRRIAGLRLKTKEMQAAFVALARAARIAVAEPELPALLDGIEQIAVKGKLNADLVALYRELGAEVLDSKVQERLYLTVAAQSRALGDRATARDYFRRVLDASPDHPRALDNLESLYLEGKEHEPLLEIYNRRAELAGTDDDQRRQYLALAARLCERELGRPAEAITCYEQILSMFPADGEAAVALDQLYAAGARFADLADLLERRLGFAEDLEQAVALHFRLGEIYEKQLSDTDRAVENYRAALANDQAHAASIAALERFLDDVNHRLSAAEELEPVYAARHDWRSLIRIYEIRLEAAEEPKQRLALTRRIARAYEEQLEDLEDAFKWYGKVFREDPTDRGIRDQLARLAGILDCHKDLAAIYDDYLEDTYEETPATLEVIRTVATIHDARLINVDKAKAAYLRLLRHDPQDGNAFSLLEALLTRASRWQDLLEVYREAADGTNDPQRRKSLLFKICGIQENALHDSEAAIESYRAILDVDADDKNAILALDRLYTAGKRWHDLVELLTRQLDGAKTAERAELKLRLGGLFEKELEDLTAAIDAYEEVLKLTPKEHKALIALERLILHHDHTFRIAQILEPLYKAQDEWAKLVVIYDAELEFIDDKTKRVDLLREIARIHAQRGGDLQLAFGALARAWAEEAAEGEAREAPLYQRIVETAEAIGNWSELVKVLEGAVEGSYDFDLVARVHARVAELHERRRNDPASAIASWRKVVGVREDDQTAWKALERLLAAQRRPAELVEVLEKRAELSQDIGEQKALAYRAAELYEGTLQRADQAVATWRQVLTLDENDRPALAALARLYQGAGNWRDLAWVYGRQIELCSSETERRPLRFAMAKVYEENLADAYEAITAYKGALDADARDQEALLALTRLYEKESQWPDLLEALDAIAALKSPGAERDAIRVRAARVLEEKQSEPEAAIDRYRQILDDAPGNEPARLALETLVRREDTREPAAAVLEPLYRARGDYRPLVDLLELKLVAENDPTGRRELLAGIADTYEVGLEDPAGAFAAWGRLLGEDASDQEAYDQIERLAEQGSSWTELAALYESRLDEVYDPDAQRALALKLAALYENRLSDDARAISRYRKALDLGGDELVPLASLDRLLGRTGQARDLAEVLERESQAVSDPDAQAEFLFRLGELRRTGLEDLDGALSAYRDALDRQPRQQASRAALEGLLGSPAQASAALDLLEPLYDADGDHKKRVQLAEVRLRLHDDKAQRASELQRIARIYEDDLKDRLGALDATVRALKELPDDPMLADEVERLAGADHTEVAASAFDQVIDAGVSSEIAKELGIRAARLYERLGDRARTESRYLAVLAVDAESSDALESLERLYRGLGNATRLVDILDRRGELEMDISAKKNFFAEVARLRGAELGDTRGAIAAWKKVLDTDESDAQATSALAALYEAAGRWNDLVEVLEQQARFADSPSDQVALKARIAALYAEKIGSLDKAVDAYRDLLDLAPDSLAALEKLEELQAQRGDWLAVQEILVRKLSAVPAGHAQVPIYRRLAMIATQHQSSPEDAIGYYQQVLDIAPDDPQAATDLHGLLATLGKWYDLVDALKHHADLRVGAGDADGEVASLLQAANVLEEKLQSPEAATEILEEILKRDPRSGKALAQLAKIYEAMHDLDRCKSTLERAAALSPGGADLAELNFRLGKLEAERTGEAAAEQYYRLALGADPTHQGAAEALEKSARKREDWSEVALLVARRAERLDGIARKPLLLELSQLYSKLGHVAESIACLEQVRAFSPDDPAVLEPLADAYFNAGRFGEALPVYQGLIDKIGKGRRTKELARLHFRMGAIAEQQGQTELALNQFQAAYQIDAGHAPTLSALGRMYAGSAEWEKARRIYRSMLLQNIDAASGVSKSDVYLALGVIHEKLNEAPKAVGMYERGLELDPSHAGLKEALVRARAAR